MFDARGTAFVPIPSLLLLTMLLSVLPECAAAQASPESTSFNAMLATADVAAGEKTSSTCAACHSFKKGGADGVGPNLWNTVGNARAHSTGFNYSDALKGMHGEKWTYEALNSYLTNPRTFAPGNKMPFGGIADPKKRADLIAWMRTLSDSPAPLPRAK